MPKDLYWKCTEGTGRVWEDAAGSLAATTGAQRGRAGPPGRCPPEEGPPMAVQALVDRPASRRCRSSGGTTDAAGQGRRAALSWLQGVVPGQHGGSA